MHQRLSCITRNKWRCITFKLLAAFLLKISQSYVCQRFVSKHFETLTREKFIRKLKCYICILVFSFKMLKISCVQPKTKTKPLYAKLEYYAIFQQNDLNFCVDWNAVCGQVADDLPSSCLVLASSCPVIGIPAYPCRFLAKCGVLQHCLIF